MSKEKFVCDSIDKAIKYYLDDSISLKRTEKLLRKIRGKLVSFVLNKQMSYIEFARTDDILVKISHKKELRCNKK